MMRSGHRVCLAAGLGLAMVWALGASAASDLPALNAPASGEHHVGKVIWADLVTPDIAAAQRFYTALFGWSFESSHLGSSDYAIATLDGRPVAGLVQKSLPAGEQRQSAWLTFLAVRDLDAAQRTALSHGAKPVAGMRNFPSRGRQAVIADPEGAVFALLASSSGDPPDYLAGPGEWIWSSLLCRDPGTEAAFYQAVFSYDVFNLASDDGREHLILSSDDLARASANSLPDEARARRAHWLNFVRVGSAADAAAKATLLGGRVLVDPHPDRHGGWVAVLADPLGAAFGVMEWADGENKAEPK